MDERGTILAVLTHAPRCVLCIAAATGVPPPRVAEALSAVPEAFGAQVIGREGRCIDCAEYRFVFRLATARTSPLGTAWRGNAERED